MVLELRKSYIFLFFILLHIVFWDYSNREVSTLIHGDWADQWKYIIKGVPRIESFPLWAKFFSMVQEKTGLAIYFAIICFSLLNTCLFISFAKILEVFDKKYSVIVAILLLFTPSSVILLLMMYKDNFSYLSMTLILLIIARIFANKPFSLSKNLLLYICSVILIVVGRPVAVPYLTLIISIAIFFSFFLAFQKSYSYKNILPLLIIFLIHTLYFFTDFNNYVNNIISPKTISSEDSFMITKYRGVPLKHIQGIDIPEIVEIKELLQIQKTIEQQKLLQIQENLKQQEELNNQELIKIQETLKQEDILNNQELIKIEETLKQEDILNNQELIKIEETLKQRDELNDQELEKIALLRLESLKIEDNLINSIKQSITRLKIIKMKIFAEIKHRKKSNLIIAPNANFNYNSSSALMNSEIVLLISHVPTSIFAPYIVQIMGMNSSILVKTIFLLETLMNYILALSVFYFLIKQKLYKIFFVVVLFSCMYITNIFDSNFGTYLRHAHIFLKLFLGIGLLGILYFFKPNININIKKGFL